MKMNWKNWKSLYREIEKDFEFSREKEERARNTLSKILGDWYIREDELRKIIGDEIYVTGFSPQLEREIELIPENANVIAADDSAVILHEFGLEPALVITDLDGNLQGLIELKNSIFGIHAHGDNIDLLEYADFFKRRFGTTQIEPLPNVYNFGGFTDGDRAVFLAAHFGAKIHLIGFDFEKPRIKAGKDLEKKRKKLRWAKYLIETLIESGANISWETLNSK